MGHRLAAPSDSNCTCAIHGGVVRRSVADAASGVRVDCLPLFPKCQYQFAHDAVPLT